MRDTERGRDQREKQAPCKKLNVGLDSGTPGSRPEPKAGAQLLSHPGVLPYPFLDECIDNKLKYLGPFFLAIYTLLHFF